MDVHIVVILENVVLIFYYDDLVLQSLIWIPFMTK